jgi:hypothetical protein
MDKLINKIEEYNFDCQGGSLVDCMEWNELKEKIVQLEEDSKWLGYLEAAGVDNWSGYEYAQEMIEEKENGS